MSPTAVINKLSSSARRREGTATRKDLTSVREHILIGALIDE